MYKNQHNPVLGQVKQRSFFPLKTTGQHSFMNEKNERKIKGITNVLNRILWRDPVSFQQPFPIVFALFLWGQDLPSVVWSLFEMFHLLIVDFFFFFLHVFIIFFCLVVFFHIVLCCETVSPPGRSTHSVREKRLTFHLKLAQET